MSFDSRAGPAPQAENKRGGKFGRNPQPIAYYNENDSYAAAWLRNLIAAGLIAPGDVDDRSITDVKAEDIEGYTQCHFFAGIGIWSDALRTAGWPDDKSVWTGSCPCQPLSVAGPRTGHLDKRHLWPAFYRLIDKRRPPAIFGEQTSSKAGREWFAGVRLDLEALGYACGAADLCSAGVGAPNIRQRLYWVADAGHEQARRPSDAGKTQGRRPFRDVAGRGTDLEGLGDAGGEGLQIGERDGGVQREALGAFEGETSVGGGAVDRLANAAGSRSLPGSLAGIRRGEEGSRPWHGEPERCRSDVPWWNGPTIAVRCTDGWRRISAQPNAFPLATRVAGRMGRLRAYGNAINKIVASEFISAASECMKGGLL